MPDTQQPYTSKELDNILSDGELDSEDESDAAILKELKLVFKGTEKSGPAIDKELADVVNEGFRSVGQSEEVKKLWEKFIRPSNVDNLQVPKMEPMKKVNKQCLSDTPRTVRVSEKTWQVIVQTSRP